MDRRYSIFIFPWKGNRVRRLALSNRAIRALLTGGVILAGIGVLFLADYVRMKFQRGHLVENVQSQQERLSSLYDRTKEIQDLLRDWKDLGEKLQASLPRQQKDRAEGHAAVDGLENYLNSLQDELKEMIASIPTELPSSGRISSGLGMRPSPWTGKTQFHAGLDIPNPVGTPVYAPANGVVHFVGEQDGNGRLVMLDHGRGIVTHYAHLSKALVKPGDSVVKGQQIADVGNTGNSTSSHLHYEVRVNGVPIDPRRHLIP